MKKMDLYKVLMSPVVTEKANNIAEKSEQVTFKVLKSSTKDEIKLAFEMIFNVKVDSVSTIVVKGKSKRFGRYNGKRADWKKAYISLKPGQNFDLALSQK